MFATMPSARGAAASLVAIVVSADGRIDAREVAELDRLHASGRLDIGRENLMARADSSQWGVSDPMVAHAIMQDRGH